MHSSAVKHPHLFIAVFLDIFKLYLSIKEEIMDTCNAKNQAKTQKNDYEWTTSKSVCQSFSPDVALLGRTPILSSRAPTSDKKKATACHQKRLSQIWCWATTFCICVAVFVCLYLCVLWIHQHGVNTIFTNLVPSHHRIGVTICRYL